MTTAKPPAASPAEADDLSALYPEPRTLKLGAASFEVTPLTIRQTGSVARIIRRLVEQTDELDIARLVAEHTDDMIEAVAIAVGRPVDEIADMRADLFLELALAVFEVNEDFFVRRVAPLLARAMARRLSSGDGETPSPTSTAAALRSPTH